jgi:hypothetical protein
MNELLQAVISWKTLVGALLIFGLLPGVCLRLIVLLYPKDSDVRRELIGELYNIPRLVRPFWVAEQLETAVFEGRLRRIDVGQAFLYGLALVLCGTTGIAGFAGALCGFYVAMFGGGTYAFCMAGGALTLDLAAAVTVGILMLRAKPYEASISDNRIRLSGSDRIIFACGLGGPPSMIVAAVAVGLRPSLRRPSHQGSHRLD